MIKKYLEMGQIVSTHGLMGEVKINPWCDYKEMLCDFSEFYTNIENKEILKVKSARPHKNIVIIKFEGVNDINFANNLINNIIYVDRNKISLDKDSYFIQDLMQMEVFDIDNNNYYGNIIDITKTGANDVYHVKSKDKIYLIPAIQNVIIKIDLYENKMYIRPLKGLLDI